MDFAGLVLDSMWMTVMDGRFFCNGESRRHYVGKSKLALLAGYPASFGS